MQQKIYFINELPVKYQLKNKTILRKWVSNVIEAEKRTLIELNYIFCSDDYLLALNKKHLNHDYYTDILTFNNADKKTEIEGDIFISLDRVRDNAKTLHTVLQHELHRVIIHGVLHLCGYKDKSKAQQQKMRQMEDFCLVSLEGLLKQ